MSNPPTPLFPVETWDGTQERIKATEAQEKLLNDIFAEACKGNKLNHTVGVDEAPEQPLKREDPLISIAWQPHNYRLYFTFNKTGFNPEKPPNHTLKDFQSMVPEFNPAYTWTSLNYGSEFRYAGFLLCDIRVKKTQVEIIPRSHAKAWRKMRGDDPDKIEEKQRQVLKRLENEARKALRLFIDIHGGSTTWEYARAPRIEDGTRGDDFLDSLPPDQVIHDEYFKKVYRHKVEFKGQDADGTLRSQIYIHNRAVEKVAPAIVEGQDQIIHEIRELPGRIMRRRARVLRRDDPYAYLFAHADEFNGLSSSEKDEWLKERFALGE